MDQASLPGFQHIDHLGIAVKPGELEAQVALYRAMGFTEIHREEVGGRDQVREVLLRMGDGPNCIQLLEPMTPDSPVAAQIERNGHRGGFAHVAYRVADIQAAFDYLKSLDVNIIDPAPRPGSNGTMVFFVHPRTSKPVALGYLIEVVSGGH